MRGIKPLTPMEMATKVVVFIFIEFQDYNGFMKRLCIYNFNGIVYKFNTKIVLDLSQNGLAHVV